MNPADLAATITKKYDTSLNYHITMYDNLPYNRDHDYCNPEKITLNSDRLIKYYVCVNQEEECVINNRDDVIESILADIAIQEELRKENLVEQRVEPVENTEPSTESIEALLVDSPLDESEEDFSTDASEDAVDAFGDIEDW